MKINIKKIFGILGISTLLTIFLYSISLFASYRSVPEYIDSYDKPIIAHGGFPITTFYYPGYFRGSDRPPAYVRGNFFLNLSIWFFIGLMLSGVLYKFLNKRKFIIYLVIIDIILLYLSYRYLVLLFD